MGSEMFDLNIVGETLLPTPWQVKSALPLSPSARNTVLNARAALKNILDRRDNRLFIVAGPCSIHDAESALEYAHRIAELQPKVRDIFCLLMRTYFEKPRTSVGWKGYINDPDLNDSFHIERGLHLARKLLLSINELGVPAANEALDPITPQYIDDLISWSAIGARTTESQTHREMASGLSTPVGFKNGTDGNVGVAVNAMLSSRQAHHFLGINKQGQCAVMQTRGNRYGHVVLRGGAKPNYDEASIKSCETSLKAANLPVNIMIDCSHGNSLKDHNRQKPVFEECIRQIEQGNLSIVGFMLESHLKAGKQLLERGRDKLEYGMSITDACIDWETTQDIILSAASRLKSGPRTA
ncbi:MAG: 3-deoxy-7-phosphoheptulonate synthase [Deltaproteobacteria bacterium]|nr:3-deoxy-7-phosphoheptulonate synthase [Deltaproteobacteria bacterium]